MVGSQFNRQRQYHLLKSRSVEIRDEEIQETKKILGRFISCMDLRVLEKDGYSTHFTEEETEAQRG